MGKKIPAPTAPDITALKAKPPREDNKAKRFSEHDGARELALRVTEAGLLKALTVDEAIAALTAAAERHRADKAAPVRGQGRRGERGIAMHAALRDRAHAAERTLAHAQDRSPSTASFIREAVTIFLACSTGHPFDYEAVAAMIATPDGAGADMAGDVLAATSQLERDFAELLRDENDYQDSLPGRRDAYMSVTFGPRLDSEVKTYLSSDAAREAGIKSGAALVRIAIGVYARSIDTEEAR